MFPKKVIYFVLFFSKVLSQANKESDDFCSDFDSNCSDCIRNALCQWCSQNIQDVRISGKHCFSSQINLTTRCLELEKPVNQKFVIKSYPLTVVEKGKQNKPLGRIVQFKPQEINLQLRKGQPMNITLSFRQVRDYPLDLYYLMDLSYSMKPHKETLAKVGIQLANTMRKLTTQFKIGFGSFVDKVMLPFVNIHPDALKNPCADRSCDTPFSFRNNLPLTDNEKLFQEKVRQAQISSNIDSPEGGFDALMQAIVCKKEIGWRKQVRKIIVFSTDAQFHSAGDGKLAGVIEPNDGKCHMEGDTYEQYDVYDYPSISHINEKTKENGVNIIFAVTQNFTYLYKQLAEIIDGASYAPLTVGSENVIEIIESVYNNITGKVQIKEKSSTHENLFSLKFYSNCTHRDNSKNDHVSCSNVKEGETFQVTVEVQLNDCPKTSTDRHSTILIGTQEESVKLQIEMLCDCKCEGKSNKRNSFECENAGYKECGICQCDEKHSGDKCQCTKDGTSISGRQSDTGKCKPANARTHEDVCSGNGGCLCEKCSCRKEHYGKFCQWDRANCQQPPSTEICSEHGTCEEGRCKCYGDWEGKYCECPHSRTCIEKGHTAICSGFGNCECGQCRCNKLHYTGKFCEDCPSCGGGKCSFFRNCVQCLKWKSGALSAQECDRNCSAVNVQTTKTLDDSLNKKARLCTFTDSSTNCDFNFTYMYLTNGQYQLRAQSLQKCPGEVNVYAAVFGVIAGIVGLGVLTLLIWKILTTLHDKREYGRFMDEYENQNWAAIDSPLYNPATTEIKNPAYGN